MDINPYESPRAPFEAPPPPHRAEAAAPPRYRLFSRDDVFFASLLGGPAAGAVLLASNYGRLGRPRAASAAEGGGVFGQVALLATLVVLPRPVAAWLPVAGCAVATVMWCVAYGLQAGPYALHRARGGQREGIGRALAIGVAWLLITSVLVMLFRSM